MPIFINVINKKYIRKKVVLMLRFGEYFTVHQNKVTQKHSLCYTYCYIETQTVLLQLDIILVLGNGNYKNMNFPQKQCLHSILLTTTLLPLNKYILIYIKYICKGTKISFDLKNWNSGWNMLFVIWVAYKPIPHQWLVEYKSNNRADFLGILHLLLVGETESQSPLLTTFDH